MGRYLNTDPIKLPGGVNLFSYVANNPLYWIDPYGLFKKKCGENSKDCFKRCSNDGLLGFFYKTSYDLSIVSTMAFAASTASTLWTKATSSNLKLSINRINESPAWKGGSIEKRLSNAVKAEKAIKRINYLSKGMKLASKISGYVTLGATASYAGITIYCKLKCR